MYRSPDPLGRHLIDQAVAKLLQEQQSRGESSRWSIREQLLNLGYGHPLTGAAAECYQQAVRDGWQPQTTNSLFIPYGHQRMLSVAVAAWGGNLVGTWVPPAADALRSVLAFSRLPINVLPVPFNANVTLPRITASGTAYTLPTESTAITGSQLTVGQIAMMPKSIGGYTELSRQLITQTNDVVEDIVVRDLTAVVQREAERQIVFGTSSAGQLTGLKGMAGVQTLTATSFNLASALVAASNAGDALDDSFGFATARNVAIALRGRQEFTNSSGTVWRGSVVDGTVADFRAVSTSGITADHIVAGPWRHYTLVEFGGGIEVAVNPFGDQSGGGANNFSKGVVGVRVFGTFDGAPTWPSAFSVAASFS